jgi:Kef-type K+ transport system membrane component KefB
MPEVRTLVLIAAIAALTPVIADLIRPRLRLPAVVLEIALGILIGPRVLDWAHPEEVLKTLGEFGLVFLIFLAGFEVDAGEVRGRTGKLAAAGWLVSLAAGVAAAFVLHALDVTTGIRFVAIALTTTAIGTLLPMLGDAKVLPKPLGRNILASGAMGEIGPIVAISVALTSDDLGRTTFAIAGFAAVVAAAAWLTTRPARPRIVRLISRTLHSSGQLGVRISVLLCVLLVWAAAEFDLDILLGSFAAGMLARLFLVEHSDDGEHLTAHGGEAGDPAHVEVLHRLESIGFGFFIPLFFVLSGTRFDVDALLDVGQLVKIPLFLALFLLVRGAPALLLYRNDLTPADVRAMAFLQAAALPLLVVITELGVESGQMRADNAAGMVGAGLLSVIIFPLVALALHARSDQGADAPPVATPAGH